MKLAGNYKITAQTEVFAHFLPRERYPPNELVKIPNELGKRYQINYTYEQYGFEERFNGYPICYFKIEFLEFPSSTTDTATTTTSPAAALCTIESHDYERVVRALWVEREGRRASGTTRVSEVVEEGEVVVGIRVGLGKCRIASEIQFLIAKVEVEGAE